MLTTHPLPVPRLRKSRSYTSCHSNAPLWSVTGPLYLYLLLNLRRRVHLEKLISAQFVRKVNLKEIGRFITVFAKVLLECGVTFLKALIGKKSKFIVIYLDTEGRCAHNSFLLQQQYGFRLFSD
jgi:hypothetical protein